MQPAVGHRGSTQSYPVTHGYVTAQTPDTGTLAVMLRDGQVLPQVRVFYPGACDAVRIDQKPLPSRGTTGVLLLLNNDLNSAVWLGGLGSTLADAISSSGDAFVEYQSHYSGYWDALDSAGNSTFKWPDNTQLVVGSGYVPIRHTVNASGQRVSGVYAQTTRVPTPAAAKPIELDHASGAKVSIASGGAITVSGAAGQTITVAVNGATFRIDGSGNVGVTGVSTIDLHAPTVNIEDGGTLHQIVTDALVSLFNGHVHSGVQSGGGNTGTPTSTMGASQLTTVLHAQ